MEGLIGDFSWNDVEEHGRYHLVDWDSVCRSLEMGGLGIRKIKYDNQVLCGKWLW